MNVKGFCEEPLIKKCKTYSSVDNYQRCLTCDDTYKLVNNSCLPGHVKNCRVYDN